MISPHEAEAAKWLLERGYQPVLLDRKRILPPPPPRPYRRPRFVPDPPMPNDWTEPADQNWFRRGVYR